MLAWWVALAWPAMVHADAPSSRRVIAWDDVNGLAVIKEWEGTAAAEGSSMTYLIEDSHGQTAGAWRCSQQGNQVDFCPRGSTCRPSILKDCDWDSVWEHLLPHFQVQKQRFGRGGDEATAEVAVRRSGKRDWYVAERQGTTWQRLLWLPSTRAEPGVTQTYRVIEARRTTARLLVFIRDEGESRGVRWSNDLFVAIPHRRAAAEWQRDLLFRASKARSVSAALPLFRSAAEVLPLSRRDDLLDALCAAEAERRESLGALWFRQATRALGPAAVEALRDFVGRHPCRLRRTHRLLEASRASEPAPGEPQRGAAPKPNPGVATQAMMLAIADGRLPLERLIDERAGVVFIDHFAGAEEEPRPAVEKLICGDDLAAFLRQEQRRMLLSDGVRDSYEEGFLTCRNRPGPPTCTFGGSMEYSPAIRYIFRVDPDRGLMLTAVTIVDVVLVDPATVADERQAQARIIERLTRSGCPDTR